MTRKAIPEATQTNILLKSRRRCCLCFWLKGEDEVKKGQLAHLDGDHANDAEGNLAFLCFEHHDEYDSIPRLSKGLREGEVKRWRDELHKEMQYRFRSIKVKTCELTLAGFKWQGPKDEISAVLQAKNTGEVGLTHLTISIRLPDDVQGKIPFRSREVPVRGGLTITMPSTPDPWAAYETRQDLFEPKGRVCIKEMAGLNSVLLPGHSFRFDALLFRLRSHSAGSKFDLEYKIDADDMPTVTAKLSGTMPTTPDDLAIDDPNF